MKRIILIFFIITGCSYDPIINKSNVSPIEFSDDLTFEEFKIKLKVYTENSSYPDIDD
jgi:hypothetical protein